MQKTLFSIRFCCNTFKFIRNCYHLKKKLNSKISIINDKKLFFINTRKK